MPTWKCSTWPSLTAAADLGHLEPVDVPQRAGGPLDAVANGLVDALGRGADDLGDAVGAVGHRRSLLCSGGADPPSMPRPVRAVRRRRRTLADVAVPRRTRHEDNAGPHHHRADQSPATTSTVGGVATCSRWPSGRRASSAPWWSVRVAALGARGRRVHPPLRRGRDGQQRQPAHRGRRPGAARLAATRSSAGERSGPEPDGPRSAPPRDARRPRCTSCAGTTPSCTPPTAARCGWPATSTARASSDFLAARNFLREVAPH